MLVFLFMCCIIFGCEWAGVHAGRERERKKKVKWVCVICVPGCVGVILYVSDAHYLLRMCKMK